MLGGARIVRFVVLQESKITASATAPPALHKKVSRLPWTHRASPESRTDGEYEQKQRKITKHFFGVKLQACYNFAYSSGASLHRHRPLLLFKASSRTGEQFLHSETQETWSTRFVDAVQSVQRS